MQTIRSSQRYIGIKMAMGAPQNQIIPPSHNSSMQQLLNWVKESFVAPKSLPFLWMLSHKILLSPRSDAVCEKQLGKKGVGILYSFYLILLFNILLGVG